MENNLDQILFDMKLCDLSEASQKGYLYHINRFADFCEKPLDEANEEDVRQFLYHLHEQGLGIGTINYFHTCIRFLFEATLNKPWNNKRIPRLRGYRSLPTVLSKQDIARLLKATSNLKEKAILSTVYGSGLRNGEVCRLKISDIRSDRMQVFVRNAKGKKDRLTILSQNNLLLLREYWQGFDLPWDQDGWLFPGVKATTHIHPATVRYYLRSACKRAGITEKVTVHTLRHSFATHMLEDGVDIHVIKRLLGHSCLKSTERYLHLVSPEALAVKSSLDNLGGDTSEG